MSHADPTLLKIYEGEQAEHVDRMRALLAALAAAPPGGSATILDELSRRAHTLKGAARAVGIPGTEQIVHRIESVFAHLRTQAGGPAPSIQQALERALDCVEDNLAFVLGHRGPPGTANVLRLLDAAIGAVSEPEADAAAHGEPAETPLPADSAGEYVRVDASMLDALTRISSQLVTVASASESAARDTGELAHELGETGRGYRRLRLACSAYVKRAQADPAAAAVAECLEFIDARLGALLTSARRTAAAAAQGDWRLRRHVDELQECAAQMGMTAAGAVLGAFGPMVRNLAHEEGKQIVFRAEGLDVRAHRLVLDSLKDAVMHLLRNAVSHGIEPPRQRRDAGKAEAGLIALRVRSRGDRLDIVVEDDGAGLNRAALAEEAARRGVVPALGEDLAELAFTPGLSTAASVSALSGRGMGLSVVREIVQRLRGEVKLHGREGGGSEVRIAVPLSIAAEDVLLIRESGSVVALPAAFVRTVVRRRCDQIHWVDGKECILTGQDAVPLARLSDLFGMGAAKPLPVDAGEAIQAVVLNSGGRSVALVVERVIENREAIVRETGIEGRRAGLSAGAIPLEDGTVAVMLDTAALLQRIAGQGPAPRRFTAGDTPRKHRILVVDDSITTRSLERSILEAHGFEVELAVDGVEALRKIRASKVDLVISDVSMPRMDGFELLEKLKAGKETSRIPVILVTSLERPEEQARGLSLGADAYIVKRKFDQRELLATVRQIL